MYARCTAEVNHPRRAILRFLQTNDEFQLMNSPLEFRVLEVQRAYGTDVAKGKGQR